MSKTGRHRNSTKVPKPQSQTLQSHDLDQQFSQLQQEQSPSVTAQIGADQERGQALQNWGYATDQPDASYDSTNYQ